MKDTRYNTTLDSDFIKVVSDDSKGLADEDEQVMLRHLEVWDDWGEALAALKRDTEAQLAKRKAEMLETHQECLENGPSGKQEYFAEKTKYERWRAGAVRFKLSVEARIAELKKLRKQAPPEYGESEITALLNLLRWASNLIGTTGEECDWHAAYDDTKNGNRNTADGKS